jgi:hypothetical protein
VAADDVEPRSTDVQCPGEGSQARFVGLAVGGRGADPDQKLSMRAGAIDAVRAGTRRNSDQEPDGGSQRTRTSRIRMSRRKPRIIGEKSIMPVWGRNLRMGDSSGSVVS